MKMVDLYSQYLDIKQEIDSEIQQVINSTNFIGGEKVKTFEQNLSEYLQVKNVCTCNSGTDAIMLALMALNLNKDDEIIVPDFTFVASLEVIALLGLKPVVADVDYNTMCIKENEIEKLITNKTKAIIVVHLFGRSANMEMICEISKKYGLYIIEDNAQAMGSNYIFKNGKTKKLGTLSHIGCTSFFPSKNLACYGDGGAVFTDDDQLAQNIRAIANHGSIKKYVHTFVGINSRLDAIQAAILNIKLKYLNEYINRRKKVADIYNQSLKELNENIICPQEDDYCMHSYHQYTIKIKNSKRDLLKQFLHENGIPSMIYYPIPLSEQPVYKSIVQVPIPTQTTKLLTQQVLSLPIHTHLNKEEQYYIIDTIKKFFQKENK